MEDLDTKITKAIVELIRRSKGRKLTLKATVLVRVAGLDERHKNILKAARLLSKLAGERVIKIERKVKTSKSKSIMYVVDESLDIWHLSKDRPDEATSFLGSLTRRLHTNSSPTQMRR